MKFRKNSTKSLLRWLFAVAAVMLLVHIGIAVFGQTPISESFWVKFGIITVLAIVFYVLLQKQDEYIEDKRAGDAPVFPEVKDI